MPHQERERHEAWHLMRSLREMRGTANFVTGTETSIWIIRKKWRTSLICCGMGLALEPCMRWLLLISLTITLCTVLYVSCMSPCKLFESMTIFLLYVCTVPDRMELWSIIRVSMHYRNTSNKMWAAAFWSEANRNDLIWFSGFFAGPSRPPYVPFNSLWVLYISIKSKRFGRAVSDSIEGGKINFQRSGTS